MTLREDVTSMLDNIYDCDQGINNRDAINGLCDLLEATGAPAYIRVAKDLRGEWVEGGDD